MNNLITLVKMQLKEKINLRKPTSADNKLFNTLLTVLGAVLKFAVVTALCVVMLILVNVLGLFSLNGSLPASVMSILFSVMLALSLLSCTVGITKAMYFSRDNAILLTLPCKPIQIYLSKLIIFTFFEIRKNFSFVVPLFIAYFITHAYPWYFYPWLIICYLFISVLTVAIGALLSVPAMWISTVFRQRRALQITTLAVAVSAAIFVLFYAISLIPPHLDLRANWSTIYWEIQHMLDQYCENFAPLYSLTLLLLGEIKDFVLVLPLAATAARFGILVFVTAASLVIGILAVKPLFYTMASKPFEHLKRSVKPKKNVRMNSRLTPFYNEFLKTIKDSSKMFSNVGVMVSIPILIFFLNKVFFAMNTKEIGDNMVIAFNLLIILLIALNANSYAASIFSRDGRSAYLIKVQPTNPAALLVAKLIPNTLFCLASFIATFVIILVSTKLSFLDALYMMLAVFFIYIAHLLYSAQADIMNPQTEIYASVGEHDSDPNEAKSTMLAFLASFLFSGVTFLLLNEVNQGAIPVFLKIMLIGLGICIYEIWLFFSKIKLYYKEK